MAATPSAAPASTRAAFPSKALLESSELFHRAQHEFAAHGIKVGERQHRRRSDAEAQGADRQGHRRRASRPVQGRGRHRPAGPRQVAAGNASSSRQGRQEEELQAKHVVLAAGSAPIELKASPFDGKHDRRLLGRARIRRRAEAPRRDRRRRDRPRAGQRVAAARRRGRRARSARAVPADGGRGVAKEALKHSRSRASTSASARRSPAPNVGKDGVKLKYTDAKGEQTVEVDKVVVAIGRRPYTKDLLAEGTGVQLDERGFVKVDHECRTGAATSGRSATACAARCSRTRARRRASMVADLIAGQTAEVNYKAIPSVIYTAPGDRLGRPDRGGGQEERAAPYKVGQLPVLASGRAARWKRRPASEDHRGGGRRRDPRHAHHRADGGRADRRGRAGDGVLGEHRGPAAHHPRASDAVRSGARSGARGGQARDRIPNR